MKKLALVIVILLAANFPAVAENTTIKGTIQAQIDAFKANDLVAAFGFASPGIRQIFGNSDAFAQMVRDGYPMVWRSGQLRFLGLRTEAGSQFQRVMIRDENDAIHLLDYEMIHVENGWRINGVYRVQAPKTGV